MKQSSKNNKIWPTTSPKNLCQGSTWFWGKRRLEMLPMQLSYKRDKPRNVSSTTGLFASCLSSSLFQFLINSFRCSHCNQAYYLILKSSVFASPNPPATCKRAGRLHQNPLNAVHRSRHCLYPLTDIRL